MTLCPVARLLLMAVVPAVVAACAASGAATHDEPDRSDAVTTSRPVVTEPAGILEESLGPEDLEPGLPGNGEPAPTATATADELLPSVAPSSGDEVPTSEAEVEVLLLEISADDAEIGMGEVSVVTADVAVAVSTTGSEQLRTGVADPALKRRSDLVASFPLSLGTAARLASNIELLSNIQVYGSYRPDMNVVVDGDDFHAVVVGSIGTRPQVYTLAGDAGQKLEAVLVGPPGTSLEVRLGDEVLFESHHEPLKLETALAEAGVLWLEVGSDGGMPGEFVLTIRISPPEPEPKPVTSTPVARSPRRQIAAGDVVYLTFDDGPHPRHTPEVLNILARHGARATFFVIGSLVEKYPQIFQQIVSAGHTVANHTWRHENLAGLTKAEFDETIGRTEEILGDHATPCLRPPYAATGSRTREWAAEYGLKVYLWTVSANDWLGLNARQIADRIVSQVTHGSIVLMHDGGGNRTQTVRGLEILLDRLSDLDLRYEPLCV